MATIILAVSRTTCPVYLFLFLMVVVLLPSPSLSADSDPLQDFCVADLNGKPSLNGFPCKPASEVSSDDFFFSGFTQEGDTNNRFGVNVTGGNVLAFPALNTLGLSMNRVDFAPGGINPPHSHPRATEAGVVIKGKLLVGFVTTANVFYSKVLTEGEMFVIPRGLMHFQINVGDGKALAFTTFNSQLPGAVIFSSTLFATRPTIPNQVLTKAFQVDDDIINTLKSKLS
ncbi:PREDICTED: germin-like protein subfamily T member 2 [Nelumbo nucifera]|uniref:Germin-like protein n=2 Tax=Nelumbo nucifera TaxID=4432 RepID=A0A822YF31_NELNU|nr:PREDICTED: germin-like protein subfamily T member 2 [Nelumbo nucifera]DAD31107.1 TPA_asm: hypothetical protein HUJ06_009958 [Nelumbo nucifera]